MKNKLIYTLLIVVSLLLVLLGVGGRVLAASAESQQSYLPIVSNNEGKAPPAKDLVCIQYNVKYLEDTQTTVVVAHCNELGHEFGDDCALISAQATMQIDGYNQLELKYYCQ